MVPSVAIPPPACCSPDSVGPGVGCRCPAEPIAICSDGYSEPAIVTAGLDFTAVRELVAGSEGRDDYGAADVIAYLLGAG